MPKPVHFFGRNSLANIVSDIPTALFGSLAPLLPARLGLGGNLVGRQRHPFHVE
jgi:hypothetical protein